MSVEQKSKLQAAENDINFIEIEMIEARNDQELVINNRQKIREKNMCMD